jgi:hypothetical protein
MKVMQVEPQRRRSGSPRTTDRPSDPSRRRKGDASTVRKTCAFERKLMLALTGEFLDGSPAPGVCTENLNPHVMVMKSAEDWVRFDISSPLNRTRGRRIFAQ